MFEKKYGYIVNYDSDSLKWEKTKAATIHQPLPQLLSTKRENENDRVSLYSNTANNFSNPLTILIKKYVSNTGN